MKTLRKPSLFWDVKNPDPQKNSQFIIERILAFGDKDDFNWAVDFYGRKKIKASFLKSRTLDKKSISFWRYYYNLPSICIQKQLRKRPGLFWQR